jgi:hypothetical protein
MSNTVADVHAMKDGSERAGLCSLLSQLPYVALIGFAAAVASAILAPNGVFLVTRLTTTGALPLPTELVQIGVTALDALTGITLGLASAAVVLSFFSREDLRTGCCLKGTGRFIGFMWTVTLPRIATFFVFCIHVIHLVLLVAYGAILAIIFLFNTILCPQIDKLSEVLQTASNKASSAGQDLDVPDNPVKALCDLAASGLQPTVNLVAGEVLFAIATACMLMSLGGTIAYNVMHKRGVRADKRASKASIKAASANA